MNPMDWIKSHFKMWPSVAMLPEDARIIYAKLHQDLNLAKEDLLKNEYHTIKSFEIFKSNGYAILLPKKVSGKLDTFYSEFNHKYSKFMYSSDSDSESEKLFRKHKIGPEIDPNPARLWKAIVLTGSTNKSKVGENLNNKADFWDEVKPLRSSYLAKKEKLKTLNEELLHELALQFPKDLKASEDKKNDLQSLYVLAYIILTLAIIGTTILNTNIQKGIANTNKELASNQIALIKKQLSAIAPLNPDIKIFLEDRSFYAADLASMHPINDREYVRHEKRVTVVIRNTGEMNSGHVYIGVKNPDWLHFIGLNYDDISGKSSTRNFTKIFHRECYNAPEQAKSCTPAIVPEGKNNLTFEIDCAFCTPQKFNQTIEICIWHDNSSRCADYERE